MFFRKMRTARALGALLFFISSGPQEVWPQAVRPAAVRVSVGPYLPALSATPGVTANLFPPVFAITPALPFVVLPQAVAVASPEVKPAVPVSAQTALLSVAAKAHALNASGLGFARATLSEAFDAAEIGSRSEAGAVSGRVSKRAPLTAFEPASRSRPTVPAVRREAPKTTARTKILQLFERSKLLFLRAATLPAHFWPFNRAARLLSHGEPLTGLTPESAVKAAVKNSRNGMGTVIGRLAPALRDIWSTRGAERSFMKLIALCAAAKEEHPGLKVSLALDAAYFGSEMAGLAHHERARLAAEAMLRISKAANAHDIAVEVDVSEIADLPLVSQAAARLVKELNIPVRLAIAARHERSEDILRQWIALARETGVRLGVRLVKGSYIEDQPDAINLRRPLLESYKHLIDIALENSRTIDVGVATHNLEIFQHAQARAAQLRAHYTIHVIKGVGPAAQEVMRKAGKISHEYVSYGMDAPVFGISEILSNWRARRALIAQGHPRELLD